MQILSVTLNNFKTHQDRQFEFQAGTNAICGENGAGKTSILEAIAWVLFNYQGSYKKEDLIRNGASSAQARVAFISSRDSRTYEVQRSTSQGYLIFDPQLNERLPYTRTKDEVLPWLRQHLGVSAGTDLSQLFANTIGVPQGTYTVDFLLPTEKRKPIFDTVLKVEEYREAYRQSNSLRKYSEAQSQRLKDLIEQYEESLQNWDGLQASYQQLEADIKQGDGYLAELEKRRQKLIEQRQTLKQQAESVQLALAQQQKLTSQIEIQQQAQQRVISSLAIAQKATDICKAQKRSYEQFLAAEAQTNVLNQQGQQRQQLLQQQQRQQQVLAKGQGDRARIEAKLEQFAAAEKELAALHESVEAQTRLELEKNNLQQQVQAFANIRFQQQNLTAQSKSLASEIAQIESELKRLEELQKETEQVPAWEAQQNRLQEQLSRMKAAQQFEVELRALAQKGQSQQDDYRQQVAATLTQLDSWASQFNGLGHEQIAPVKAALFQGGILSKETLNGINSILADLSEQTDLQRLKQQQKVLQNQLQRAYAQKAELMAVGSQQAKREQLTEQNLAIQKRLSELGQQLDLEAKTAQALAQLEAQIQQLDNPKGRGQLLKRSVQQQASAKQQHKALVVSQAENTNRMAAIATQLQAFEPLDNQLQQQQQAKQTHQAGYLQYLQNQQAAGQLEAVTAETTVVAEALFELQEARAKADDQLNSLRVVFDPEALSVLDQQLSEVNSQADQLKGSLPQQRQRFAELTLRIDELRATAQKRDEAQADLKQSDRLKRFVNYARKVYKDAGPRITERYVHNISKEADRLFRELLGRQNVALTWSADYEITVQEGAHARRFINLSGGEQMCAALAVRLALLKVLADIDIAFFDEPTTNMDRPRRAGLAEAIARLKSFNQLFVISHDDTFEQVTETVITVTRDR
ncbi:MAG: SMC family ATPase [Phormidesmis sp.]